MTQYWGHYEPPSRPSPRDSSLGRGVWEWAPLGFLVNYRLGQSGLNRGPLVALSKLFSCLARRAGDSVRALEHVGGSPFQASAPLPHCPLCFHFASFFLDAAMGVPCRPVMRAVEIRGPCEEVGAADGRGGRRKSRGRSRARDDVDGTQQAGRPFDWLFSVSWRRVTEIQVKERLLSSQWMGDRGETVERRRERWERGNRMVNGRMGDQGLGEREKVWNRLSVRPAKRQLKAG